jgi:RNA polymerase sigma factor (sigma-70 family)
MNIPAESRSGFLGNELEELKEAVARDDDPAISRCFGKLQPYLRATASRYSCRECDWPSLEQVAFIAIVRAARQFDSSFGRPFEHYACVALRNAVLDEVRQMAEYYNRFESIEMRLASDEARHSCCEALAPSPFDLIALAERVNARKSALETWISERSERQRLLVQMLYFDGIRKTEAARRLGVSKAAISKLNSAMLQAARSELAGLEKVVSHH